jgi:hypothetical protein
MCIDHPHGRLAMKEKPPLSVVLFTVALVAWILEAERLRVAMESVAAEVSCAQYRLVFQLDGLMKELSNLQDLQVGGTIRHYGDREDRVDLSIGKPWPPVLLGEAIEPKREFEALREALDFYCRGTRHWRWWGRLEKALHKK